MTLVLTFLAATLCLTALFWGLALVLQGYLYSQPADKLPLRSLVAGLAVACFLCGWVYLNTHASHPDKYGTLFEMNPGSVAEVNEFEAVRLLAVKGPDGKPREATAKFRWQPTGGRDGRGAFIDPGTNREFQRNTSDYQTVALLLPNADGSKARFDADLPNGRYPPEGQEFFFSEQSGGRHIYGSNLRLMVVPDTGALILAVLLNVLLFVIWFVAFWPILRFSIGHALGLTVLFGAVSLFILVPQLFVLNAVKPTVPTTAPAVPK